MIIVVDNVRGNSGKGVAMFSRTGKQTINQHVAFAAKKLNYPRQSKLAG